MNRNINTDQRSFPRQFVMLLAVVAAVCYGIAYKNYSNGEMYYDAYLDAYSECVSDPLFGAEALEVCKTTPAVREQLSAHNSAYDSVAPFLTFGFSVTVAVLLSPLTHRGSRWVEDRMVDSQRSESSAAAA